MGNPMEETMGIREALQSCKQSAVSIWAKGADKGIPDPWLCYINLTNRCNNRCYFCGHGTAMRESKGLMSFDLFRHIVAELPAGVRKIYLIKQGEPFAHPQLEEFVAHLAAARPDIHIALHTNAIMARKERAAKILPLVRSLGVSVSAISRETYKQVHQTDKFAQVLENLAGINELLQELPKEKRPHVFVDYVVNPRNAHEDQSAIVAFHQERFPWLGSVDFHAMYNFQGEIDEANLKVYERLSHNEFPTCVFPWSSIAFLYDGKVGYCFVEPREERFLGDINKQSFMEIWDGDEYAAFRRRMAEKQFKELANDGFHCHECSWLWSPHSIAPVNLAGGHTLGIRKETPPTLSQIMIGGAEDAFFAAVEAYLSGEVHQAIGYLAVIEATSNDETIEDAAKQLKEMSLLALAKFRRLSQWLAALDDEGVTAAKRRNRYFKLEKQP
jgi:MoaA/NifB/PqqE/SkfB family radical SAM enzyme